MSDHYFALTVILEKDLRDEDAKPLIETIKMLKGVLSVKPEVSSLESCSAKILATTDIYHKILKLLREEINFQ